jgi:hypothetical protein
MLYFPNLNINPPSEGNFNNIHMQFKIFLLSIISILPFVGLIYWILNKNNSVFNQNVKRLFIIPILVTASFIYLILTSFFLSVNWADQYMYIINLMFIAIYNGASQLIMLFIQFIMINNSYISYLSEKQSIL